MKKHFALFVLPLFFFACAPMDWNGADDQSLKKIGEPVASSDLVPVDVFGVSIDNLTDGMTVNTAPITIAGKVSPAALSVSVSGYKLSKYEPGSGEWSYFASPELRNLNIGENTFNVVATDEEGKSASVSLSLNYVPTK